MYESVVTRKETLHSGNGILSSENKNVGSWPQNFSSKMNEKINSLVMHLLAKFFLFRLPFHVRRTFSTRVWKRMICIFAFLGFERGNLRRKWLKILKTRVFKMDFEDVCLQNPFCSRAVHAVFRSIPKHRMPPQLYGV